MSRMTRTTGVFTLVCSWFSRPPPSTTRRPLISDRRALRLRFPCDLPTSHCPAIDVVNVNDWLVVEPETISTWTTTSVPAVT